MIIINSIGLAAIFAMVVYIACFLCRYKVIPQSLSVTAEWSGRYFWWQCTICTVMGFLGYWTATLYPYFDVMTDSFQMNNTFTFYKIKEGYKLLTLIGCAGAAGLSLAGYYSYSPGEESKRTLFIHKVGSFSGAVLLCLFYILKDIIYNREYISWIFCTIALGIALLLGIFIKGKRIIPSPSPTGARYENGNSIVFWMELAIMVIISTDIICHFIEAI